MRRWGSLHAIRSCAGLAAFIVVVLGAFAPLQTAIHSVGLVTAGLFAGSGVMEVIIQQPARVAASPRIGLDQMQRVLARADPYMPLLAAGSFLASAGYALRQPAPCCVLTVCLFGSIFPWSAIAIKPVNQSIKAYDLRDAASPTAVRLVRRWGRSICPQWSRVRLLRACHLRPRRAISRFSAAPARF